VAPIERFQTTTTSFLLKVLGYVSCPITSDSYRTDIGKCPTSDPIRLQASDDTSISPSVVKNEESGCHTSREVFALIKANVGEHRRWYSTVNER